MGVLRPLDVRVSLGGPLPLLPLLDSLAQPAHATARAARLAPMVLQLLTALLRGGEIYFVELARSNALGMLTHLLARCPPLFMSAELLPACACSRRRLSRTRS